MPPDNQLRQKRQNMGTVKIYQLDRGCGVWLWLCETHLAARKLCGWIEKEAKDPPHPVDCDDCRENPASLLPPFYRQFPSSLLRSSCPSSLCATRFLRVFSSFLR